jgi:hypothetical protein
MNGTKQEYRIDRTELFRGDVLLQREVGAKRRRERSRSRSRSSSTVSEQDDEELGSCDMTPTIDALGELAGEPHFHKYFILYFYKHNVPNRSLSLCN